MTSEPRILSFKDWMAENNRTYYSRNVPGKAGDFITSPVVHRAFGEAIGRQLLEMDAEMGHPNPFFLMEFGGGNGDLSLDILRSLREYAPEFSSRLSYGISDFPESIERFRGRFEAEFPEALDNVSFFPAFGFDNLRSFQRLQSFQGCVLANEFLDALPIHLVVKRGIAFREVFIAEGADVEFLELPPSPEVIGFIETFHLDLPDGCFAEINLEMHTWVRGISSSLKRGFALIIDYGGKEEEIRGDRSPLGTLRGFRNHRLVEVSTLNLGEGDWTSDIDFSTLARVAQMEGFSVTGFSTQGNFLLGLGIAERLPTFKKKELSLVDLREHLAMKLLFHPEGLGNAFHVLGLHKGVSPSRLAGFSIRQEDL